MHNVAETKPYAPNRRAPQRWMSTMGLLLALVVASLPLGRPAAAITIHSHSATRLASTALRHAGTVSQQLPPGLAAAMQAVLGTASLQPHVASAASLPRVSGLTSQQLTQQQEITASDGAAYDDFGWSVALSSDGTTALIGTPNKSVGGNRNQGAAYVFVRNGSAWTVQQELTASNGVASDWFGRSVALSGDGSTALVGAYGTTVGNNLFQGAAYVFVRSGTTWSQQQELTSSDGAAQDWFGWLVTLSSDGSSALVGDWKKTISGNSQQGAAYVFVRNGTSWTQQQELTASDGVAGDWFGRVVTLNSNGSTALIGAPYKAVGSNSQQGAVYVFVRNGSTWTMQQELIAGDSAAGDEFGSAVALSADGSTALIGAIGKALNGQMGHGATYVFVRSGSSWSQQQELNAAMSRSFGSSVALSSDGSTALIGAASTGDISQGAAFVFVRSGTTWSQQQELTSSDGAMTNDWFGWSVAESGDGKTALIGAPLRNTEQGAAYVFVGPASATATAITMSPTSTPTASATTTSTPQPGLQLQQEINATRGADAVALSSDGSIALIGSTNTTVGSANAQGAAYVFVRSGGTWTLQQELTAADGAALDGFGGSVALSSDGSTALISAPTKAISGNNYQGAAYVFVRSGGTWSQQAELNVADGATYDLFGRSVTLSGDGSIALIGESGKTVGGNAEQGAAYVFVRNGGNWSQQQELTAADGALSDQFGSAVALSRDGSTALIGADNKTIGDQLSQGTAYVFVRNGASWSQQQKLTAADGTYGDLFGNTAALSSDGSTALIGAVDKTIGGNGDQGAAYVFTRSGSAWSQQARLISSDGTPYGVFGGSVALTSDGNAALIGAHNMTIGSNNRQGAAYLFVRSGTTWTQQQELIAADGADSNEFGTSAALNSDGSTALIGAGNKGTAYVYGGPAVATATATTTPPTNTPTATATASGMPTTTPTNTPQPGLRLQQEINATRGADAVALSSGGSIALIGSYGTTVDSAIAQGAAYVFVRTGSTWTLQQELTAADGRAYDRFGVSVALSGDGSTALIGANTKTIGSNIEQGAAYVFVRTGSNWSQQAELTAADGAISNGFGSSVALSGDGSIALIGAFGKAVGGNGGQGAAYMFVHNGGSWSQQAELTAADGAIGDSFGNSVALSSDGSTALIGAANKTISGTYAQGAAYVFVRNGGSWVQQQKLTAADGAREDVFGSAAALSSDGSTALISAVDKTIGSTSDQGAVYIFMRSGGIWSQQARLISSDGTPYGGFGWSAALTSDGNAALIGANNMTIGSNNNQGAAYLFVRSGSTWSEQQELLAADGAEGNLFGSSVALNSDGSTALIGATNNKGTAYVFAGPALAAASPTATWEPTMTPTGTATVTTVPSNTAIATGTPTTAPSAPSTATSTPTNTAVTTSTTTNTPTMTDMPTRAAPTNTPTATSTLTNTPVPPAGGALSPKTGSPFETSVVVTGAHFTANELLKIYWDNTRTRQLATTRTSAHGSFITSFSVPQAVAGRHIVIIVGQSSRRIVQRFFTVTPALLLAPTSGPPGSPAYAVGVGFGIGERVVLLWYPGLAPLNEGTATAQGTVVLPFTVPARIVSAPADVIAYGTHTKQYAVAPFTVTVRTWTAGAAARGSVRQVALTWACTGRSCRAHIPGVRRLANGHALRIQLAVHKVRVSTLPRLSIARLQAAVRAAGHRR